MRPRTGLLRAPARRWSMPPIEICVSLPSAIKALSRRWAGISKLRLSAAAAGLAATIAITATARNCFQVTRLARQLPSFGTMARTNAKQGLQLPEKLRFVAIDADDARKAPACEVRRNRDRCAKRTREVERDRGEQCIMIAQPPLPPSPDRGRVVGRHDSPGLPALAAELPACRYRYRRGARIILNAAFGNADF